MFNIPFLKGPIIAIPWCLLLERVLVEVEHQRSLLIGSIHHWRLLGYVTINVSCLHWFDMAVGAEMLGHLLVRRRPRQQQQQHDPQE